MLLLDAIFVPNDAGDLTALSGPITSAAAAAPTLPTDVGMALIKMLLTVIALIALLCATYWFLKRLVRLRLSKGVGKQSIEILEKKMISAKTMLYLVQVENKKILLAESHLEIKGLERFSIVSEHSEGQQGMPPPS